MVLAFQSVPMAVITANVWPQNVALVVRVTYFKIQFAHQFVKSKRHFSSIPVNLIRQIMIYKLNLID